jgi:uncharacterized DUF497 family protein
MGAGPAEYRDELFEWDERKSADRLARSGFDFHVAKRVFASGRYVERWDEAHSAGEARAIATGSVGPVFLSVVYVERGRRKRIISAFEADDDDIADYMVTYAISERS